MRKELKGILRVFFIPALLLFLAIAQILLAPTPVQATLPLHHDLTPAPAGAYQYGLYGYDNPAALIYLHQPDFYFTWSNRNTAGLQKWGFFGALPGLGFGMVREETAAGSVRDYRLATAIGDRSFAAGLGYGWSRGDTELFARDQLVTVGFLARPNRWFSAGATGYHGLARGEQQLSLDLAWRPKGNEVLTIFTGLRLDKGERFDEGRWAVGFVFEGLTGLRITGQVLENSLKFGASVSLGRFGYTRYVRSDQENNEIVTTTTHGIRFGAYDRTFRDRYLSRGKNYLYLDLRGDLGYRHHRFFDSSNTLQGVLTAIAEAERDPSVGGIALNLSGMNASAVMQWEIREQLREFQKTGKRVVVYIDHCGITGYHLASVADYIVMDPHGTIYLTGFALGRAYWKGTLEKLGIGVEEIRFAAYKSAMETYTREEMSEADREQYQRWVDVAYEFVREEIMTARGLPKVHYELLVNKVGLVDPETARKYNLVDAVGRWDEIYKYIEEAEGKKRPLINPAQMPVRNEPYDDYWGEPPQVAVIYALGVCDLETGIGARRLAAEIRRAAENRRVKTIVLRVDSPGGSAQAADLVAAAVREAGQKKPVIVSQGEVAASGGYWLSMYGDTILAAPHTMTGSIGVITGWFYDKGFKDKIGLSTDLVKRGHFADFGYGIWLPFVNISLADRPLREEEYKILETRSAKVYEEFLRKVAEGRGMEYEKVKSYAGGRVWSGQDSAGIGLIDGLGGLADAIWLAKEKAGLAPGEKVRIVEYPAMGWFSSAALMQRVTGIEEAGTDPLLEIIKFRTRHNGEPLPLLPLEFTHVRATMP
jgi:protease-4